MTHPIRTTLAAISLVLCGLSAGACVVSYVRPWGIGSVDKWQDAQFRVQVDRVAVLGMVRGRLFLRREDAESGRPASEFKYHHHWSLSGRAATDLAGRTWRPYTRRGTSSTRPGPSSTWADTQWTLPLPLLVLLFALLPLRWAILRRRERRRKAAGICVRCGYDLRGSNSGKCSECGEPIPAGHTGIAD